ncbi:MAG: DUF2062 domain-containing protein [Amaricoccus sp.]
MVFKRRNKPPLLTRIREAFYPRRGWRRGIEYLGHRVRRLPDTPHKIAIGFAAGVFVSFTPLFGLHIVLGAALAWLVRGNIVASLIGTLAGNPVTTPFIAAISLALGRRILGHGVTGRDFGRIAEAFSQAAQGLWQSAISLVGFGHPQWGKLDLFLYDMVWPYFVGGLLPGLIAAIASYYLTRPLIAAYQMRRRARMLERAKARLEAQETLVGTRPAQPYNVGETGKEGGGA